MNYPIPSVINRFKSLLLFWVMFLSFHCFAFEIPPKPSNNQFINDFAQIIPPDQELALNQICFKYYDSTSTDIVVVTVNSIGNQEISMLATQWYNAWGIGDKDKDNGVLILINLSTDDPKNKRIFISTGRGVEGFLTDGICGRIIREIMAPEFKEQRYANGIKLAIENIIARSKGEYKREHINESPFPAWLIILIIIIVVLVLMKNSNNGGTTYTNGTFFGPVFWGGGGNSNWGGSDWGGGGGGFSGGGFGGGSSGGGGAGGSW